MAKGFNWPEAVLIESTRGDTLAGYAPRVVEEQTAPNRVEWVEGRHLRAFDIQTVERAEPDAFTFKDIGGDRFTLRPMTLELYEKHVRQKTAGKPKFATMAELLGAMRDEW